MIRERRTNRWRCKFELLAVGDGNKQIVPLSRGVGGTIRRSILRSKAPPPSLSLPTQQHSPTLCHI
jgi:hypothetical protein